MLIIHRFRVQYDKNISASVQRVIIPCNYARANEEFKSNSLVTRIERQVYLLFNWFKLVKQLPSLKHYTIKNDLLML